MLCYILDDQYGKTIYEGLASDNKYIFPIKDNITNPLDYIDEIIASQPDYILLDNYFPNRTSGREEPLGNEFLERIEGLQLSSKILCISDYGKKLIDKYDGRHKRYQEGKICDFVSTKDPQDLKKYLQ